MTCESTNLNLLCIQVNRLKDVEQALASATALSQQRDVEANRAKLSLEAALREKEELKVQLDGTVRALNGSKSEQQIANERNTAELKRVTQALEEALGKVGRPLIAVWSFNLPTLICCSLQQYHKQHGIFVKVFWLYSLFIL